MTITLTKQQFGRERLKIGTAQWLALRLARKYRIDTPEGFGQYTQHLGEVSLRAQQNGEETVHLVIEGILSSLTAPPIGFEEDFD